MAISTYTTTALKRWSCQDHQLPSAEQVKEIHVYDFDNTLFASPMPNKQLWASPTIGHLMLPDFMIHGGWWHNPNILTNVGQGLEKEEPRAWEGCWNENIVDLVRLSMRDPTVISVLLTGRSEHGFSDLLGRMVKSKELEFDMMCLKPSSSPTGQKLSNTMHFKQTLLKDLVFTYPQAEELRIYEDRVKHVKEFRDFFTDLNQDLMSKSIPEASFRKPFIAEVVPVNEEECSMDPETEIAEVQKMINNNNKAVLENTAPSGTQPYKIKRSVFYTGYQIAPSDTSRLRNLIKLPPGCPESEPRYLADNILIVPRAAPRGILQKVGGLGTKVRWRVTGYTFFEERVWAVRVEPIPSNTTIYSENPTPCVVLATRRGAKPVDASRIQNWQPVGSEQALEFDTTIGEKVLLRIEPESDGEEESESRDRQNTTTGGKRLREEDFPALGSGRSTGPKQHGQSRSHQGGGKAWGGRGGGGSGGQRGGAGGNRNGQGQRNGNFRNRRNNDARGGRGGNGGGGGGRSGGGGGGANGGRPAYRSLDDNVGQNYGGGGMQY